MRISLFLLLPLLAHLHVDAQQGASYPSPEYQNQPYYYDAATRQLIQLEKSDAKMKSKTKAFGYGGSETYYKVEGEKSAVTINSTDTTAFVFSGGFSGMGMSMDISNMIGLYKFRTNRDEREAVIAQQKGYFGGDKSNDKIDFNVKKSGDDYVFIISKRLAPGEYGFINMMDMKGMNEFSFYCFHIE